MRRGYVAFSALVLVGVGLTGCGRSLFDQREPWRVEAEEACLAQKLVQPNAYMARDREISGPGACGITYPFKIAAFGGGEVGLSQKVTLACPVIPRIDGWLNEVVQPAAQLYFDTTVAEMRSGSYSCRPRNNQRGAKLSEHSFGNAVDIMSFRLADGRNLTVVKGWRGAPEEQEFLREIFVGACRFFTTVLGPGADPFHYDHFHLDLARHDPRGQRRVCKPLLKFTPRLDLDAGATPQTVRARLPAPSLATPAIQQQAPVDVEEEDDPFAVSGPPSSRSPAGGAPPPRFATPIRPVEAPPLYNRPPIEPRPVPAERSRPLSPWPAPAAARQAAPERGPVVLQPQLWDQQGIY